MAPTGHPASLGRRSQNEVIVITASRTGKPYSIAQSSLFVPAPLSQASPRFYGQDRSTNIVLSLYGLDRPRKGQSSGPDRLRELPSGGPRSPQKNQEPQRRATEVCARCTLGSEAEGLA